MNFVIVKAVLSQFRPLGFAAMRMSVASIVMAGFVVTSLRYWNVSSRDVLRLILLGLVGFVFTQAMFIIGIARTSASNSALIQATTPIAVALISYRLGSETLPRRGWIGVLLSLAGVAMVICGSSQKLVLSADDLQGNLLVTGSAIGWAVYIVMARSLVRRIPATAVAGCSVLVGATGLLIVAAPSLRAQDWSAITPAGWIGLVYTGGVSVGLANLIWAKGIERLGGTRTSIYGNLTPVVGVLGAAAFLYERLTPWQIVGGFAVLTGIFLAQGRTERTPLAPVSDELRP